MIDEVLNLKVEEIRFYDSYMTITLPKCKNDQSREGNVIYVSELHSKYCPVFNTAVYIHTLGLMPGHFLICKLKKIKKGHKVMGHRRISDSSIRKNFIKLSKPFFPGLNIGLHGLRAGGASAAARNNVTDRLISKHGRWLSERGRDGYIKDSLRNRLHVTKSLGL